MNPELERAKILGKERREKIQSCPKCGKDMKMIQAASHVLLRKYKCKHCSWEGTAWKSLHEKGFTMYGDDAMPYERERMRIHNKERKKMNKNFK